ncbi:MAG: integrase core domain-containing protein [Actinomycetes bacterium]|nr:integrase core domain-containing protein [Actinomycetes bacterium]
MDNVRIERWFRTLKSEYVYLEEFESPRDMARGIAGFIEKYNTVRLHESLDYQTPADVYGERFVQAA